MEIQWKYNAMKISVKRTQHRMESRFNGISMFHYRSVTVTERVGLKLGFERQAMLYPAKRIIAIIPTGVLRLHSTGYLSTTNNQACVPANPEVGKYKAVYYVVVCSSIVYNNNFILYGHCYYSIIIIRLLY